VIEAGVEAVETRFEAVFQPIESIVDGIEAVVDVSELSVQPLVVPLRSCIYRATSLTDKMFHKARVFVTFHAQISIASAPARRTE
jgi:hypothetical protein